MQLGFGLVHQASLEGMCCAALWMEPVVPDAFVVYAFDTVVVGLKLAFGTEQNVGLVEQLVDIALRSDSCAFAVLAVANAVGEDMWVPWAVVVPVVLEGQTARHLCWHTSGGLDFLTENVVTNNKIQ